MSRCGRLSVYVNPWCVLTRAARRRPELLAVRLAFEIARGDERSDEIDGVADDRRHDEPLRAVRLAKRVEVLRELDLLTKGYAVRAQVSGPQVRRRDFERTALRAGPRLGAYRERLRRRRAAQRRFPARARPALQTRLHLCGRRGVEVQQPRLRALVGIDSERVVPSPRDVQAAGPA